MRIDSINSFLSSTPIWDTYSVPSVKRPEGEPVNVPINRPGQEIRSPLPHIVDTCSKALPSHLVSAPLPPISKLNETEIAALKNYIERQLVKLQLLKV